MARELKKSRAGTKRFSRHFLEILV
ncbi:DUF1661 domain-containing protein [Porphyromonas gingivalis]|nr:DUF1661 domain-containing protein [Porphyromonas gingivalis]